MHSQLFFAVLTALALPYKCHGKTADQCPAQPAIYGKALKGYTFKTSVTSSSTECLVDCHYEDRCQSYNYVTTRNICEMNNRTKEAKPDQFVTDSDRFYMKRGAHRSKVIVIIPIHHFIKVVFKSKFYVEGDSLHCNQNRSAPLPPCQHSHARKSKQMKEDKRSAVTRGWMPLVLERLSWLTVT